MNSPHQGFVRSNINQFAFVYRLVDILIINGCLLGCCYFYLNSFDYNYLIIGLLSSLSYSFLAETFVLYRSWRAGSLNEMLFYVAISWCLSAIVILAALFFLKESEDYSRVTIGLWFLSSLTILCTWRVSFRFFLHHVRRNGRNSRAVGIIGLTPKGMALAEQIAKHPETGFKLVAIFDARPLERLDKRYQSLYAGGIEEGVELARNGELETLFVALPMHATERIKEVLEVLGDTTANVHLIPDMFIYQLVYSRLGLVGQMQTISVYENPMKGAYGLIKRFEDLLLASVILLFIALPMLGIAIGVKLTSPGPVLFKQDRYGVDGKKIKVWKFRSMRTMDNGNIVKQATKGDARITPFGAFLRRTSLDELPQFFNVLQGSMSVVGPRPHAVSHNEEYRRKVRYYMLRHKIKPGITGWAQVNGWRGETDTDEKMAMRIQFDIDYIQNWSLWMDFKIVIYTFFKGFVGKNVY